MSPQADSSASVVGQEDAPGSAAAPGSVLPGAAGPELAPSFALPFAVDRLPDPLKGLIKGFQAQAVPQLPLGRWWPLAATLAGGWVVADSLHLSSVLPLAAAGLGCWLLARRRPAGAVARLPRSSEGWIARCETVLAQFERLAGQPDDGLAQRLSDLEELKQQQQRQRLDVGLSGCRLPGAGHQAGITAALASRLPMRLHWSHPLPAQSPDWQWPHAFSHCDHLIYCLDLPLQAADLRWLEALPAHQSAWLLVDAGAAGLLPERQAELEAQLPQALRQRWFAWSPGLDSPGLGPSLRAELAPLVQSLERNGLAQIDATVCRCLEALHGRWQAELEALRRERLQQLVNQTQWAVAAGVVLAPLPSLDLLVLAGANGLMLQEMGRLWDSPWSLEQLQAAGQELAKAALQLGVVEWTSQALAGLGKWHGATWLLGSAVQALSAAYLTRVVARAMADYLALASGVAEADLALLKAQAPLLVARAAETEKLDWSAFVQQGQQWLRQQAALGPATPGAA